MPLRLSQKALRLLEEEEEGGDSLRLSASADSLEGPKRGLFAKIGDAVSAVATMNAPFKADWDSNAGAALNVPKMLPNAIADLPREVATLAQGVNTIRRGIVPGIGHEWQRRYLGRDDTDDAQIARGLGGLVFKGPGHLMQRELLGTKETPEGKAFQGVIKGVGEQLTPTNVVEHPIAAASTAVGLLAGGAGALGKMGVKSAPQMAKTLVNTDPLTAAVRGGRQMPSLLRLGKSKATNFAQEQISHLFPYAAGSGTGVGDDVVRRGIEAGVNAQTPVTRYAPVKESGALGQTMEGLWDDFLQDRKFTSNEKGLRGDRDVILRGGDLLQAESKAAVGVQSKKAGNIFDDLTNDKSLDEITIDITDVKDEWAKHFEKEGLSVGPDFDRVDDTLLSEGAAVPTTRARLRNEQGQITGLGPEPGTYEGAPLQTIVQKQNEKGVKAGIEDTALNYLKTKGEEFFNLPDEVTVRELFQIRQNIAKDSEKPIGAIFGRLEDILSEKIATETSLIAIADKEYADAAELVRIVEDAFNVRVKKKEARKGAEAGLVEASLEETSVPASGFDLVEDITGYPMGAASAANLLNRYMPPNLFGRGMLYANTLAIGAALSSPEYLIPALTTMFLSLPVLSPRIAGMLALRLGKNKQAALEATQKARELRTIAQQFQVPQNATIAQVLTRLLQREEQEQPFLRRLSQRAPSNPILQRLSVAGGPR